MGGVFFRCAAIQCATATAVPPAGTVICAAVVSDVLAEPSDSVAVAAALDVGFSVTAG